MSLVQNLMTEKVADEENQSTKDEFFTEVLGTRRGFVRGMGKFVTKFLMVTSEKKDVTVFLTQIVMLQPVSYASEDGLQIKAF